MKLFITIRDHVDNQLRRMRDFDNLMSVWEIFRRDMWQVNDEDPGFNEYVFNNKYKMIMMVNNDFP